MMYPATCRDRTRLLNEWNEIVMRASRLLSQLSDRGELRMSRQDCCRLQDDFELLKSQAEDVQMKYKKHVCEHDC